MRHARVLDPSRTDILMARIYQGLRTGSHEQPYLADRQDSESGHLDRGDSGGVELADRI